MGIVQSAAACLTVFVHVVVLDLAKIPFIGVHQMAEHVAVAVVGKAHLTNFARAFLFLQPFLNAQTAHLFPGGGIGEHVHQVIIHMIGTQPFQFFPEQFFHPVPAADEIMGQLGSDLHLIAHAVLMKDLAQRTFAAGINVSGIKIVHAAANGVHDLSFCFFHIDASHLLGKTHAAKPQYGNGMAVFIHAVLH